MARTQSKNELLVIEKINLIEYYNTQIVPLGEKYKPMSESHNSSICPFHIDTDPSLHYWKQKGIFHCFGCGFGGDVVKTHIQLRRQHFGEKLSIDKAVEQLATLFDIELDKEEGFIVKSVFEQAREVLLDKNTYVVPKDVMTVAEFRQLNNKVKTMNIPQHVKVANFEHLDAVASVVLNSNK